MAEKYWYRVYLMTIIAKYIVWYVVITFIPAAGFIFLTNWPKQLIIYGIPSFLCFLLWLYYYIPHVCSTICVFNQMFYYVVLRFDYCNHYLEEFSSISYRAENFEKLRHILQEHNQICSMVSKFNGFWSYPLLLDAIQYTSLSILMFYLALFSDLVLWFRIFLSSLNLISIICLYLIFSSSYFVTLKVYKLTQIY